MVGGSNPFVVTKGDFLQIEWEVSFFMSSEPLIKNKQMVAKISLTRKVRTTFFLKSYPIPSGNTIHCMALLVFKPTNFHNKGNLQAKSTTIFMDSFKVRIIYSSFSQFYIQFSLFGF
jgi:hypothetical protein